MFYNQGCGIASVCGTHLIPTKIPFGIGSGMWPDCCNIRKRFAGTLATNARPIPDTRSLVIWWEFVVDVSYQGDPYLGRIISSQDITHKARLDLHLDLQLSASFLTIQRSSPTISKAPFKIPQRMLENQSSSCERPSSGSSTKSASGFSSNVRENCLLSLVQFETVGVIFRNILNPVCAEPQVCQSSLLKITTASV